MNNLRYDSLIKFASYKGNQAGHLCKFADDGMLATILNAYKGLDPTAQAAILGGGGGAAIGGLGNALFGNKKRGLLSRLGSGALVGGGLGALGGAGINEGAIRLGMGRTGADRDMYLSGHVNNASDYITPPVDYAKSMLSKLVSPNK